MQKVVLLIIGIVISISVLAQTNSFVTEYYLSQNFSPKSGVTPGSNNTQFMDCDQIITRYNVNISGITSTGNRLPSQNQLASVTPEWSVNSYYSTATSTSNVSTSITTGIGQNLTILSIVTKNGGRTGGVPTYNGNAMSSLTIGSDVELYYVDEVIDGIENIYIPNTSSDTIMYSISSYKYYGNVYKTGAAYSNTTNTANTFYLSIATSPSHYNLIVSVYYAYSNSQSISSDAMTSAPITITTTTSASQYQRTKTGYNPNYTGSGTYSSSVTSTVSDYIAIASCSFYVY